MAKQSKVRGDAAGDSSVRRNEAPRLAKLTRPELSGSIPRLRLFKLLDEVNTKPLVWVHGPPGAGKTTLVASYLSARGINGLWYQVDRDDRDPASFFYYLRQTVPSRDRPRSQVLPLLTPEYLPDIEGFARKFFRSLYAQLAPDSVVVFDNHQEVTDSPVFQKLIALAATEAPPGFRIIVISRIEPSGEYARLLANGLIAPIGWQALRLTVEETARIAAERRLDSADSIEALQAQSDGWVAGAVLLIERLKHAATLSDSERVEYPETVFNYFAGQVFELLTAETRELLLRTAMLPQVTVAFAEALTGCGDAQHILEDLYRRQFFIDRRSGKERWYQYHALFRVYLLREARLRYPLAEWNALLQQAAGLLVARNNPEEAATLYLEAGAWSEVVRLVLAQAQRMLDGGRWQTLRHWIESLPEAIRHATPWLGFWLGMCRLRIEPAAARAALESAFASFQQADQMLGQVLAATAILEAHMVEWVDYRRLDPWIAALETLLSRGDAAFPSLQTELAVRASLFTAIVHRQTHREDIPQLARQVGDMLRHDLDPNYKLLAARGIFVYGAYSGDFVLIDQVVSYTESAFNAPAASALNRAWYAARLGFALRYLRGAREKARVWFRKAREIVREHGLGFVEAPIAIYGAWAEEVFGDTEDIERELQIAEAHLNPASRFEAAFRQMGIAFLLARQNDLVAAVIHMRETFSFMELSGYTLGRLAAYAGLTGILSRANDFSGAREALDGLLSLWFPGELHDYAEGLFGAGIAFGLGDEECATTRLRLALALGAKHGLECTLSEHFIRRTTAALCTLALKHGIETDYVKKIVRAQRLSAPSPEAHLWPWPVRIHVLGRFTVHIDDQPLTFTGKGPKKPLELLKALVAMGGDRVDAGRLGEQLWPDADAVRETFNVTHARLRKLLPIGDVVVLNEGKLSLNAALVWTDAGAFERTADQCSMRLKQNPTPAEVAGLSDTLLSLYGGELLKGESEAPWMIGARDRLQSKFLRTLRLLGAYWEEQKAWGPAQDLYERVLEIDNVAEDIYRRLMRCFARAGQPAEALRVYRRCRQMLSLILGIAPSAETETLIRAIRPPQP